MQRQQTNSGLLREKLQSGLALLDVESSSEMQSKLIEYLDLLIKWNKVYNLTSIRDPLQMVEYHLLDSLAILPHIGGSRWLDVGSGAGLPGMVLAIARPGWSVTLLDSNSKKTGFLQQVVIELGLSNVIVCCKRVEEFQTMEKFDAIISRAFTELGEFIRMTRHLIARNGKWFAMKGLPERELLDVPEECLIEQITTLNVPGLNAARCLIAVAHKGEAVA